MIAAVIVAVTAGCSSSDTSAVPTTTGVTAATITTPTTDTPSTVGTTAATTAGTTAATTAEADASSPDAVETLPPVESYSYDTTEGTVIVQISSRVPRGPAVPLLTVYGDGLVIAGTTGGWYEGRLADGDVQLFLDDAESVGLLDESLSLRGPDTGGDPDLTVVFDVDGMRREHEFDLSRIERPVALRAFLQDSSVYNRFELSEPFDPGAWLSCDDDSCSIVDAPTSPADRPILPHEDAGALLG